MADKLIIVLMNSDPRNPSEVATSFTQASVAAAIEYDVEIILNGPCSELASLGFAEKLSLSGEKTVYDLMRDTVAAGVKLKVCTSNLDLWSGNMIPEIDETVGAAYIISEAMDDDSVTFTY